MTNEGTKADGGKSKTKGAATNKNNQLSRTATVGVGMTRGASSSSSTSSSSSSLYVSKEVSMMNFECTLLEDLLDEVKEFLKRVPLRTVHLVVSGIVDRLDSLQEELLISSNQSSSNGGDVADTTHTSTVDNPSTIFAAAAHAIVKKAHEYFEGDVLLLLNELTEILAGFGVKSNVSCRQIGRKSQKGDQKLEIVLESGSASKGSTVTRSGKKRSRDEKETEENDEEEEEEMEDAAAADTNLSTIGMNDIFENILLNLENGLQMLREDLMRLPRPAGIDGVTVIHPETAAQAMNDADSNMRQKFFKALVNPQDYLTTKSHKNKNNSKNNHKHPSSQSSSQGQSKPDVCILADKAANCTLAGRLNLRCPLY